MSLKAANGEPSWAPILVPHFINIHSRQVGRWTDGRPETNSRALQFFNNAIFLNFTKRCLFNRIFAYTCTCIHLSLAYLLQFYRPVFPPIRHHRYGQVDIRLVLHSGGTGFKSRLQHRPFCPRFVVTSLSLSRQIPG